MMCDNDDVELVVISHLTEFIKYMDRRLFIRIGKIFDVSAHIL